MDAGMPEMNGYEATQKIKKLNKKIPIIMQSAFAQDSEIEKAKESGVDDYIPKPTDLNELHEMMQKHFDERQKLLKKK